MFFSVKQSVKIAGKVYTPCVCYPLSDMLAPTIEKMEKEGKVYIFKDKVYFQNGKVLSKNTTVISEPKTDKPKKAKKEKAVEIKDTEDSVKEAEAVPSPEEVADNLGGF